MYKKVPVELNVIGHIPFGCNPIGRRLLHNNHLPKSVTYHFVDDSISSRQQLRFVNYIFHDPSNHRKGEYYCAIYG